MMRKANVGVPKDKWAPPAGYKSALGKARDEARKKSPGKVSALTSEAASEAEDTASDSEYSDADSVKFSIRAMRQVKKGIPLKKTRINAVTRLAKVNK